MILEAKLEKWNKIDTSILLNEILKRNEQYIINLNRNQLFDDGIVDSENPNRIYPYAESTRKQKIKKAKFPKVDFITLKWDGIFQDGMFIEYLRDRIRINSTDEKWNKFRLWDDRFTNALGLTRENFKELISLIRRELLHELRQLK